MIDSAALLNFVPSYKGVAQPLAFASFYCEPWTWPWIRSLSGGGGAEGGSLGKKITVMTCARRADYRHDFFEDKYGDDLHEL